MSVYSPDCAQVENNLFFGNKNSTQIKLLEDLGIDYVFHFGFTINERLPNIKYEYFEIEDNFTGLVSIIETGKKLCNEIDELLQQNKKVLVCCQVGRSRSATIIVLYLHHKYPDMTYYDVVTKIKQVRTISINKTFEDFLITHWNQI